MNTIEYKHGVPIVEGTAQSPIPTTETALIDNTMLSESTSSQVSYLASNTQAALRGNLTLGSLTSITLKVYYYTDPNYPSSSSHSAYQRTTSAVSSGTETLSYQSIVLGTSGMFNYDFAIAPCTGIKVTVTGTGTATGSSLTEFHIAFKTN